METLVSFLLHPIERSADMRLRNPTFFLRVTLAALVVMTCSCAVPLAPGADQVKLTENAADVAGCKPVGNVSTDYDLWQPERSRSQLRNKTVGLDGNTVFLTSLSTGVAYRCQQ
jgi:hypothetical protein